MFKVLYLSVLTVLFASTASFANTTTNTTNVKVNVGKVSSEQGVIYIFVCDENGFKPGNDKKYLQQHCSAFSKQDVNGQEQYTFNFKLPKGEYVFFGYIDTNLNGELEKNIIGMPKEPMAFSIKLKSRPTFKNTSSKVEGSETNVNLIVQ